MQSGISPMGTKEIPLRITSTQENPKVKLGRKSKDLKETENKKSQEKVFSYIDFTTIKPKLFRRSNRKIQF